MSHSGKQRMTSVWLRARAARLREVAANAMPPSIAGPLLDMAAALEKRALQLDLSSGTEEAAGDAGVVDGRPRNRGDGRA
jgi:hypothetical protein